MVEAHAIDVRSEWRTFSDSVKIAFLAACIQSHCILSATPPTAAECTVIRAAHTCAGLQHPAMISCPARHRCGYNAQS